ncbi:MAG: 4Fe-4S binding protein [Candidatus Thermoplasmatota archaeon]
MKKQEEKNTVKVLKFHPEKCIGCRECEKACSQIHFKTEEGGDKSAIRITEKEAGGYEMSVCDQRGLCIDICPVGALYRKKNGVVWLDEEKCVGCQMCVGFCPIGSMRKTEVRIEPFKCISCGACVRACPQDALELVDKKIDEVKEVVYHKFGD